MEWASTSGSTTSASVVEYRSFYFGLEIEVLIGGRTYKNKRTTYKSWDALAEHLSQALKKAGLPNTVDSAGDYSQWSIVREVTIKDDLANDLRGLELVSRTYMVSQNYEDTWIPELQIIFNVLNDQFSIRESTQCSTHVHVSADPPFTAEELASLGKAIVHFEPALNKLVPAHRHGGSHWNQSNRASVKLRKLDTEQCLDYIERHVDPSAGGSSLSYARTVRGLKSAMNLCAKSSRLGKARGEAEDFVHGKVYKWNFDTLDTRGDLEYRQPPGSMSFSDAYTWVEVTVSFVCAVTCGLFQGPSQQKGMDDDLYDWLRWGAGALHFDGSGIASRVPSKKRSHTK